MEQKIEQTQVEIPFEQGSELSFQEHEAIINGVIKQRAYLLRREQPVEQRMANNDLITSFIENLRQKYTNEQLRETRLYHTAISSGDEGASSFSLNNLIRFDFFENDSIQNFFQREFDKRAQTDVNE